jgi:hypothetical protein
MCWADCNCSSIFPLPFESIPTPLKLLLTSLSSSRSLFQVLARHWPVRAVHFFFQVKDDTKITFIDPSYILEEERVASAMAYKRKS